MSKAPAAGSLMFSEAAQAHAAVRAQLAGGRAAEIAQRIRALSPRAAVTCARGSSDHAATFAKYLIETRAGVLTASAAPSVSSVYAATPGMEKTLFLVISQSGASPDLIATAEAARRAGALVVALVNAENSPIAAVADEIFLLSAGPERSVAATKSFIASLGAIIGLVAAWTEDADLANALQQLPDQLEEAWKLDWSAALPLAQADNLFVIARGLGFGAAGEAALKLKETCGLHAEAFSAAEVRHGPMALVREGFHALAFAQPDRAGTSVAELAGDMARRGAAVFLAGADARGAIRLPTIEAEAAVAPALIIQSFYRFAHDLALARGRDPDRPPHLSKVTETV
jgi:glucosamine--fructose-6-phosphate aminotransferase (isomerizing)